jgi:hypothetical protein
MGVHIATSHHGNDELNSSNPGVYVRHESCATAGAFRNSYDRWSAYAGCSWQTSNKVFGLTVGAVTGYPAARVMALVVPSVRMPIAGGFAARISYIPKPIKSGTASGFHLSIETEL